MQWLDYFAALALLAVCSGQDAACNSICITTGARGKGNCFLFNSIPDSVLSCKTVQLKLMEGTHILTQNMDFSNRVENIEMNGVSSEQPIVECRSESGISFNKKGKVAIQNVAFKYCGRTQIVTNSTKLPIALYFHNIAYAQLENVTVTDSEGFSLYAYRCETQVITHCQFERNSGPVKLLYKFGKNSMKVDITESVFADGQSGENSTTAGLEIETTQVVKHGEVNISNCTFRGNNGRHLLLNLSVNRETPVEVHMEECTFSEGHGNNSDEYGVMIRYRLPQKGYTMYNNITSIIENCRFTDNKYGGLIILNIDKITINDSLISHNKGSGIFINRSSYQFDIQPDVTVTIANTTFKENYRALFLILTNSKNAEIIISSCNFIGHNVTTPSDGVKDAVQINLENSEEHTVSIHNSYFDNNTGIYNNCLNLNVTGHNTTIKLDGVNFTDNYCTAIALIGSHISVTSLLNITRNHGMFGGGIYMRRSMKGPTFPRIIMQPQGKLVLVNNSANTYGGGIFTEETCERRSKKQDCLFKFKEGVDSPWKAVFFEGNVAELGGDSVFGGCLHNCSVEDVSFPLERFMSFKNNRSMSTLADVPYKVVFCGETHNCNTATEVEAFRGEMFQVKLMVMDQFCVPSSETIHAIISPEHQSMDETQLQHGQLYLGQKNCTNYNFSVIGSPKLNSTVVVQLFPQKQLIAFSSKPPSLLTVSLKECPGGFTLSNSTSVQCVCYEELEQYDIQCSTQSYTLVVHPFTWIGLIHNEVTVNKYCQHCMHEGEKVLQDARNKSDSDKLCTPKRTGVLCGSCFPGYSLQLGENRCADCKGSTYKGVLLLIFFAVVGILLILVLLSLNLTVSTGLLNGLIFYSNIVHANSEIFLPINRDSNTTTTTGPLQNTVWFFSAFQAWVNLDFGVNTCFFDHYTTYTSSWTQFAFSSYICLLVLLLVLVSRRSSRVSRLTGSHTVPVLATLLLTSFSKLLLTSISAGSFTVVSILGQPGNRHKVWVVDGNLPYLRDKHVPLFLASGMVCLCYILPFSLLVGLGPLMQTHSHWRPLRWIHRAKPFLDAFYGPYNQLYRYWPGLLLAARLLPFGTFALYSHGSVSFKVALVVAAETVLLTVWVILGRSNAVSPHRNCCLNYLELFFHCNLTLLATGTIYFHFKKNQVVRSQQILAVVMVGSVFAVFSGILLYQVVSILRSESVRRAVHKLHKLLPLRGRRGRDGKEVREESSGAEDGHYPVEVTSSATSTTIDTTGGDLVLELREPLLAD